MSEKEESKPPNQTIDEKEKITLHLSDILKKNLQI